MATSTTSWPLTGNAQKAAMAKQAKLLNIVKTRDLEVLSKFKHVLFGNLGKIFRLEYIPTLQTCQ